MKNAKTAEAVREREREREPQFSEINRKENKLEVYFRDNISKNIVLI